MIDPKELRIGNLVLVQSRKLATDISDVLAIDKIVPQSCTRYHPIPITPEWLERFGFEKRESSTCVEYYIGINDITHDWLFSLTWLLRPELINAPIAPFYRNGRHTIHYVHQLQNLYFALTGKELTIK